MRPLQLILGMIGLLIVTTQTFRHAYVLWIEPTATVLARFEDKTEKEIAASKSVEELVALYEEARRKVKEHEEARQKVKEHEEAKGADEVPHWQREQREPYKSEALLKRAIQTWEAHSKQIYELHFFWWCGLASAAAGLVCYVWVNRWLGIVGLIAGFSEMIWWTSPSLRVFRAEVEFDRLLALKLIYSSATWALLVGVWCYLGGIFGGRGREALPPPAAGAGAAPPGQAPGAES